MRFFQNRGTSSTGTEFLSSDAIKTLEFHDNQVLTYDKDLYKTAYNASSSPQIFASSSKLFMTIALDLPSIESMSLFVRRIVGLLLLVSEF